MESVLKEGIPKLGGSAEVLRCVPNRIESGRHQGRMIVLAGRLSASSIQIGQRERCKDVEIAGIRLAITQHYHRAVLIGRQSDCAAIEQDLCGAGSGKEDLIGAWRQDLIARRIVEGRQSDKRGAAGSGACGHQANVM